MSEFDEFDSPLDDEGTDEPQSMSLLGGIAGGGALPGPEGFAMGDGNESKRISQQSFLIGLIVTVVAFGALTAMRVTQTGAEASAVSDETKQFMADYASRLANLDKMDPADPLHPDSIKETFRSADAIVAAIQDDQTRKQVPVDQVQMNPFTPVRTKTVETVVEVDTSEQERDAKLKRLYSELTQVDVQSLVGGDRARAFIGGDLYKVGDTIGSFRIKDIDNRRVLFEAPGFELRDGEAAFALGMKRG